MLALFQAPIILSPFCGVIAMRATKRLTLCLMFCSSVVFVAALCLCTGTAKAAGTPAAKTPEVSINGRVTEVTLYRGQAMVTRTIPVDGAKGEMVVVVGDLPEQIVAGSLYADGSQSIQVRAVRYLTKAVEENSNPEIRELDASIEAINDKIRTIANSRELLGKRSTYLDQLETGYVQPTVKSDLSKGVLDAGAVEKITKFIFDQRKIISDEQANLDKINRDHTKELAVKESNRAKLTKGTARTERQALLFVEKLKDGRDPVRLNYLVAGCGWAPAYTFRAGKDRKEVAFEYNALIQQTSGESWDGVKLTLSTASPTVAASGPGLGPFNINPGPSSPTYQNVQRDLSGQLKSILSRQEKAITQTFNATNLAEQIGSSWSANTIANEFQVLELTNPITAWNTLQLSDLNVSEGTNITYPPLAAPVSLASRSDQQIVLIHQGNLKSKSYLVATPVLTTLVYREAELVNTEASDLLGGPATVYLDGRFVGRSEIPTVASGQTFVVGFGVDPQVRAYRTLLDREDKPQGANRQLSFKYQLSIVNFKEEPVSLRLFDRVPYYSDETSIRIRLGEIKDKVSEDPLYARTEKPKNLLRWDLEVPGKSIDDKVKLIDYGFTVEMARSASITTGSTIAAGTPGAPNEPALQQEFEQLQRNRQGGMNSMGGGGGMGGGMGGAAGGRGGAGGGT
jgi:uncharacterized protein (TIGR02231 family)